VGAPSRPTEQYAMNIRAFTSGFKLPERDAADAAPAIWLHLFEHMHRPEHPARAGFWLAIAARRECLRNVAIHKRLASMHQDGDLDGAVVYGLGIKEGLLSNGHAQAAREAVVGLPGQWPRMLQILTADPSTSCTEFS